VLPRPIVSDGVSPDELGADVDLDGVNHDAHLDLSAALLLPTPSDEPANQTLPESSTLRVTETELAVARRVGAAGWRSTTRLIPADCFSTE